MFLISAYQLGTRGLVIPCIFVAMYSLVFVKFFWLSHFVYFLHFAMMTALKYCKFIASCHKLKQESLANANVKRATAVRV